MKAKFIVMIVLGAIVTLSFTVSTTHKTAKTTVSTEANAAEPAGGLVSEDPLK